MPPPPEAVPARVEIREDVWLSERFGHPVFKVENLDAGVDETLVRGHAEGLPAATYHARTPTRRIDIVRSLSQAGFVVVNTGVTLRHAGEGLPQEPRHPELRVREGDLVGDRAALAAAADAGRTSRFHLDPAVPTPVAHRIRRDWVTAYLRGDRGERLLVAARGGRAIGFLGALNRSGPKPPVQVIDLIGVAEGEQGSGAGRALVESFLADAARAGAESEVGTQAANDSALRFYERLGFRVARTFYDLHLHAGAPWRAATEAG